MGGIAAGAAQGIINTITGWGSSTVATAEAALAALAGVEFSPISTWTGNVGFNGANVNLNFTAPSAPSIGAPPQVNQVTIPSPPSAPSTQIPGAPSFGSVSIPSMPYISIPSGDFTFPPIVLPEMEPFTFTIPDISEDVLSGIIRNKLSNNILYGGTGLSAEVEEDIWNRDLERNERQLSDSTDKSVATWAKKGFSLPDGMLANSLSDIQKEYMNRRIDRSREIAIKQAELEQTNIFKSIESGIGLIKTINDRLLQYQELVFKVQESTAKFANEYIGLRLEALKVSMEAYKTQAAIYEAQVRGALARAEVYAAQVKGVEAGAGVMKARADIYKAQVEGALANAEVYKAQMQGFAASVDAQKAAVEASKAVVEGWAAGVNAQAAAHSVNVAAFKAQSDLSVSAAQVGVANAEAQAKITIANLEAHHNAVALTERSSEFRTSVVLEAAKGAAQAAASLAAGVTSGLHGQGSVEYRETMELEPE